MSGYYAPRGSGDYQSEVKATVKWYNSTKGFGFVQPDQGGPDAFLHASVVTQAGHQEVVEGAILVCDIARGPRGPQVSAIHSIDTAPPSKGSSPPPSTPRPRAQPDGPSSTVEGTVKFFNAEKGFGFIVPDDGSRDVFVSVRILNKTGIQGLEPDQRVRVTSRMGEKGPNADQVDLI